jgi:hypothetical protein
MVEPDVEGTLVIVEGCSTVVVEGTVIVDGCDCDVDGMETVEGSVVVERLDVVD